MYAASSEKSGGSFKTATYIIWASFMSSRTIDHSGRDEFRKPPEPVVAVETVLEVVSPVVVTGDDSESLREVSSDGE